MGKGNANSDNAAKTSGGMGIRKRENISKMRDLLSKARDERSTLFTQGKSKRLEFSNLSLAVYDKHKILINDIFLNTNINTFVSYNDKSLHSWNPETRELISEINFNDADSAKVLQPIQCLCYSNEWHLYFACSKNNYLMVFNEHLNLVQSQKMPVGLVQIIKYFHQYNQLIVGGKEGCFIIDLHIDYKYKPGMAILLDPKGQSITVKIKKPEQQHAEQGETSGKELQIKFGEPEQIDYGGNELNENMPVNYNKEEYGTHIKQLQGVGSWVYGLKVFEEHKLIVMWKKELNQKEKKKKGNGSKANPDENQRSSKITETRDQVIFYALNNSRQYKQGEVWSRYYDSSLKEDFITDILIFTAQKFFITAHNFGDIHLRKLVEFKTQDLKKDKQTDLDGDQNGEEGIIATKTGMEMMNTNETLKSVHVFKGHSRTVTSLAPIKSKPTYFVSASKDGKVRIWCFEKMIELYCFDIAIDSPVQNSVQADSIQNVKLISDKIYAMIFKSFIEIGLISHLASSYYISKQDISCVGKCYQSNRDQNFNRPGSLFMAFNDNSIVLLDPADQQVQSTIYPPPTPAEVTRVFYCTSIQRMFLLLKTGSICVYKVDKEPKPDGGGCVSLLGQKDQEKFSQTGTLERLQESKSLKDYEGKSLSQSICSINKCYTQPPQYDCEIFSDLYKYREPSHPDYQFIQDPDGEDLDQFLVIGLSKGSIIFVKVNNLDQIYARFSIHREKVKQIYEIRKDRVFLSICKENILCIWGFDDKRERLYHKFNLHRKVMSIIVAKSQQLLMCFKKGDSEILVWNQSRSIEGQTYIQNQQEGVASYHFPTGIFIEGSQDLIQGEATIQKGEDTADKTEGPYISYASAPDNYCKLLDGSKPPAKKYFEDPKYDPTTRVFTGKIMWGENTLNGGYSSDYRMVFSSDFSNIESGQVNRRDAQGNIKSTISFAKTENGLNYEEKDQHQLCELQEKDKSDEHEDIITCCDSMQIDNLPEKTLFVTGDEQGLVKIWNSMKVLIREVKFVEPVNSVAFLNEKADLIVGHSGNLSRLYAVDYMDKSAAVTPEAFEEYMASKKKVDEKWFKKISQKGSNEEGQKTICCSHPAKEESKKEKSKAETVQETLKMAMKQQHQPTPKRAAANQSVTPATSNPINLAKIQPPQASALLPTPQVTQPSTGLQQNLIQGGTGPHINIQAQGQDMANVSQSNSGSAMNSTIKMRNMKQQLHVLKNECVKIPSVPPAFMKNRKKIQAREKQIALINNSTRRMMTEQRIQRNIAQRNAPGDASDFHDIFVSQSASQGNLQFAYKTGVKQGNNYYVNAYNQQKPSKYTSKVHQPQRKVAKFHTSYMSDQTVKEFQQIQIQNQQQNIEDSKISHMQQALQVMANSANTFSIFDNNSFDPSRTYNAKLAHQAQAIKQQQEFLSQNSAIQRKSHPFIDPQQEQSVMNNFVIVQMNKGSALGHTNQAEQSISVDANKTATQGTGPPVGADFAHHHHYVANFSIDTKQKSMNHDSNLMINANQSRDLRQSEEFNIGESEKKQQESKLLSHHTGLQKSPSSVNQTNTQQNYTTTLKKSQLSTMGGRNPADGLDTAHSPKTNPGNVYSEGLVVGTFAEQNEKQMMSDQSKLDHSNHDSSPVMSMKHQNARLQVAPKTGASLNAENTIQTKAAEGEQNDYQYDSSPTQEVPTEGLSGNKFLIKVQQKQPEGTEESKAKDTEHQGADKGDPSVNKTELESNNDVTSSVREPKAVGNIVARVSNKGEEAVSVKAGMSTKMFGSTGKFSQGVDDMAMIVQQKEFSQKIRGSSRAQAPNHFLLNRINYRTSNQHQLQPHLVTNAVIKDDIPTFTQKLQAQLNDVDLIDSLQQPVSKYRKQYHQQIITSLDHRDYAAKYPNEFSSPTSMGLGSQKTGPTANTIKQGQFSQKTSHSPQSRALDHRSLAEALVNPRNEQVQYGLTQNQTVHRKGALITSQNNTVGMPVYCKNTGVQQGIHMPSKGLFNTQKQKPRTAADGNGRQKYKSVTNKDTLLSNQQMLFQGNDAFSQQNGLAPNITGYVRKGAQFGSMFGSMPSTGSGNLSKYKANMNNIQMFQNYAVLQQKQIEFQKKYREHQNQLQQIQM